MAAIGATGHWVESGQPESAQRLFESWGSINRKVPAWGSHSWHFDILDILVSQSKQLPLISIIVGLEVIPSAFSCYSWCLPIPRRLGAAEEHWHELVIVRGHLLVIVRGLVPSLTECQMVTLVNCSCH